MTKLYRFECGCEIPIDSALPAVNARPSLIYPDDITDLRLDCPVVYEMLAEGRTKGVFQLESPLGRQWTKRLKPGIPNAEDGIEHLAALGSILRPGVLKSRNAEGVSLTEQYCRRKNGEEDVTYFHPSLEPILNKTYGTLIFQEGSIAIAVELAGFSLAEADELRAAIAKKKTDVMARVKTKFMEKSEEKGLITSDEAYQIFSWIEQSQKYQFNRCLSNDTVILRAAKGKFPTGRNLTLEDMYNVRNNIDYAKYTGHLSLCKKWKMIGHYGKGWSLCNDGRVRPNIIRDIQPAGIRTVYKITLDNGATIRVTANHKFPTPHGELCVSDLTKGDRLYTCGDYEKTNSNIYKFSNFTNQDRGGEGKAVNGQFGESNWGYTNGSYTSFIKNKQLLPLHCQDCEATGRVKRGEKGYPALLNTITSIEQDGECMTYDVTMDGPNHTFATSTRIITSNSHAVSYALIGYHTAHFKAHFPLQFYTSWLYHAQENQDPLLEIRQLINEAKSVGIEVLPPRFEDLKAHFNTDGIVITFGLSDVKGIGQSHIAKIRENVKLVEQELGTPRMEWSWYDFLIHLSPCLPSTVVERMIEVGALRKHRIYRQRMLAEYRAVKELTKREQHILSQLTEVEKDEHGLFLPEPREITDLTEGLERLLTIPKGVATKNRRDKVGSILKLLKNPPQSLVDTADYIAKTEEECLGVPITCTRIDDSPNLKTNITCKEFRDGKTMNSMVFAVDIQECREHRIQNGDNRGKTMAFLVISDKTGSLDDVCIFSKAWKKYGSFIYPGNTVEIKGRRDPARGSLIVEQAWKI